MKIIPFLNYSFAKNLLIQTLYRSKKSKLFSEKRGKKHQRHRLIQRAGRFTRPQGQLTLTMSSNQTVRKDLMHFLDVLQKAA